MARPSSVARKNLAKLASSIQLKRAYESPEARDGVRILVDRLWARGVSKEAADLDAWMNELGPTAELRKWFGHRPDRWDEFIKKYQHELATPLRQLLLAELDGIAARSTLTLVYGAHDAHQNEAVVLRHYLLHKRPRSNGKWGHADKLLLTVGALAAAHHNAIGRASSLLLFASSVLTKQEIDGALKDLLMTGMLRKSSGGWRVTPRGLQRIRLLPRAGSGNEPSS
jgi:uncharacterized protein YeaO (DUF488 family)